MLDRTSEAEGLRETLSEQRDLVNPARRLRPSELFSEKPSLGRSGDLAYGLDDHRDAHVEGMDIEFARLVVTELADLLTTTGAKRLIVCASPRMLGHLRDARAGRSFDIQIDELARDFVKLTATELRSHLERHGLVQPAPERERVMR